jgi:RND family efflux transporter MFP subunit
MTTHCLPVSGQLLSISNQGIPVMDGHSRYPTVGALASIFLLAACSQQNQYVAPPVPKVTVAAPVQRPVIRYLELTGNAAAVNSANLVARVPGFIQEIDYRDGALVEAGRLLFTIEPEPYAVKLSQAQAAEASAAATLKQTQTDFDRFQALVTSQAASRQQYDQALASRDKARASFQQAQADTRLAALNDEYAHVKAPFDGIVSARQVSVGEFVGGTAAPTVLATIVQINPIYVNFNISEQDVQRLRAEMQKQGLTRDDLKLVPVEIGLQTESGYPHAGTFDYASPSVTSQTGTLVARGVFENADRVLLPGYFVRARIPVGRQADAMLVPDVALGSDQGGRYVLLVNKDNAVEHRNVKTGPLIDDLRVIEDGLGPADRVVIAGVLRAIPGQRVEPSATGTAAVGEAAR